MRMPPGYRKFTSERDWDSFAGAVYPLLREDGVKPVRTVADSRPLGLTVIRQLPLSWSCNPDSHPDCWQCWSCSIAARPIKGSPVGPGERWASCARTQFSCLLALTLLQSVKWPLLLWSVGQLFEQLEQSPNWLLALARRFHAAPYFWAWVLPDDFSRRGWWTPIFAGRRRAAAEMHHRVARLEHYCRPSCWYFLPWPLPQEVGVHWAPSAWSYAAVDRFFPRCRSLSQGKVSMALSSGPDKGSSLASLQVSLVWVPPGGCRGTFGLHLYRPGVFPAPAENHGLFAAPCYFTNWGCAGCVWPGGEWWSRPGRRPPRRSRRRVKPVWRRTCWRATSVAK